MALSFGARLAYVWISGRSHMRNLIFDFGDTSIVETCLVRGPERDMHVAVMATAIASEIAVCCAFCRVVVPDKAI